MSFASTLPLVVCAVVASPGYAESPLMAPIHQYIDAFNTGHPEKASGAFATDAILLDEIPPYVWRGPGALQRWAADAAEASALFGATGERSTLGQPTWADIKDKDGYIVLPEAMDELVHGQPWCERGLHSFSLHSEATGWKITGSGWALSAFKPGACGPP